MQQKYLSVFLLFYFSLCSLVNVYSQNWSVGNRIGMNLAIVGGEDSDEYANPRFGWNVGAVANYSSDKFFNLQFELNYSQRGYFTEEILASARKSVDHRATFNYDYIENQSFIRAGAGRIIKFEVLGGISTGILIKAFKIDETKEDKINNGQIVESLERVKETNVKDKLSDFDMGLIMGSGITIPRDDRLSVFIDIRYYFSFIPLLKNKQNLDIRNEMAIINTGFLYKIGKIERHLPKND